MWNSIPDIWGRTLKTLSGLLVLVFNPGCGDQCGMPDWPPEGDYKIVEVEGAHLSVTSVNVTDDVVTIEFVDESGASQWVKYRISMRDFGTK